MPQPVKPIRVFFKALLIGLVLLGFLAGWTITGRMITSQSDVQVFFGSLFAIGGIALAAAFGKYVVNFFKELENADSDKGTGTSDAGGDSK